jgi:hypothetical protein
MAPIYVSYFCEDGAATLCSSCSTERRRVDSGSKPDVQQILYLTMALIYAVYQFYQSYFQGFKIYINELKIVSTFC